MNMPNRGVVVLPVRDGVAAVLAGVATFFQAALENAAPAVQSPRTVRARPRA